MSLAIEKGDYFIGIAIFCVKMFDGKSQLYGNRTFEIVIFDQEKNGKGLEFHHLKLTEIV